MTKIQLLVPILVITLLGGAIPLQDAFAGYHTKEIEFEYQPCDEVKGIYYLSSKSPESLTGWVEAKTGSKYYSFKTAQFQKDIVVEKNYECYKYNFHSIDFAVIHCENSRCGYKAMMDVHADTVDPEEIIKSKRFKPNNKDKAFAMIVKVNYYDPINDKWLSPIENIKFGHKNTNKVMKSMLRDQINLLHEHIVNGNSSIFY